ncbi:peptidase M23B [Roseiflexus castenholzii DSM 13941]|uniref:Peptidase M23B n=2 Tax=Roseiflexus castenholzii TaxID=120962 RepID=A7NLD4_ROSCS|nr:peptidase M23B [Roseiflexus castenholzii DSM 13941]
MERAMSFVTSLKIFFEYLISVFIWSIFNPYGLVQTVRQATGQCIAIGRACIKGVVYDDTVSFALPFEGTWKVVNGGIRKQTSHSWILVGQRYAYDFVVVDESGKTYQDSTEKPKDYFAFGRSIIAAEDGVVADVRDNIRDYFLAGKGWVDITTPDIRGNYVLIKHDTERYTLYAHLKVGSITVKKGETVVSGQKIGECGHSGHSSEPHLHFQLQDRADFYTAISLPVKFRNFERSKGNIKECVVSGFVERDYLVRNIDHCTSGIIETTEFIKPTGFDLIWNVFIVLLTLFGMFAIVARMIEFILDRL